MSSDTVSSLFPDRPIRPLPKRRLRERLSPDVADSIKYPPAPQSTSPLFYYPYSLKEDSVPLADPESPTPTNTREAISDAGHDGVTWRDLGVEGEGGRQGHPARKVQTDRPVQDALVAASRLPQRPGQTRHGNPPHPPSTASSADGYDFFENTNNKKKRKIPTAGDGAMNGAHILNDSGALGISLPSSGEEMSSEALGSISTPYYQSIGGPASNQGISGPGRGRYGRIRNGRSPLRALSDTNNNWAGRAVKLRPGLQYPPSPAGENTGIISNAIATAEKLPAPEGQENVSLLHRRDSLKSSPAPSQFTFTFDSQVPGSVAWPGSDPTPIMSTHQGPMPTSAVSSRSLQTGPGTAESSTQAMQGSSQDGNGHGASGDGQKKPRRHRNSLMVAARRRKQQQQHQNSLHPPAPENVWICEFCEYELIFGRPPEALIRQYERKDQKRRREDANRKTSLEKAKMKSRKGKKASKLPAKNAAAATASQHGYGAYSAQAMGHDASQGTQSEDYEEDYYDDDGHSEDLPPLIPVASGTTTGPNFEDRAPVPLVNPSAPDGPNPA